MLTKSELEVLYFDIKEVLEDIYVNERQRYEEEARLLGCTLEEVAARWILDWVKKNDREADRRKRRLELKKRADANWALEQRR